MYTVALSHYEAMFTNYIIHKIPQINAASHDVKYDAPPHRRASVKRFLICSLVIELSLVLSCFRCHQGLPISLQYISICVAESKVIAFSLQAVFDLKYVIVRVVQQIHFALVFT